jgi:hypothetical protein
MEAAAGAQMRALAAPALAQRDAARGCVPASLCLTRLAGCALPPPAGRAASALQLRDMMSSQRALA